MKFNSKYLSLSVYHEGRTLDFRNGEYETTDKAEIKTLKHAMDVKEVEEIKSKDMV